MRVVFPEPVGPMRANTSDLAMPRLTCCSTLLPSYTRDISTVSIKYTGFSLLLEPVQDHVDDQGDHHQDDAEGD